MSLESATKISELVATNPAGTDPVSQGDDHIKMLKAVLQANAIKSEIGQSATPANNFTLDASADDGTMVLARATGEDIITVDATGHVVFPLMKVPVLIATNAGSGAISNNTPTKLTPAALTDTTTAWDSPNSRYVPAIAGYYRVTGKMTGSSDALDLKLAEAMVYKNGAVYSGGSYVYGGALVNVSDARSEVSTIVPMNGSTDYVELWGRVVGSGNLSVSKFEFYASLIKEGI